MQRCGTVAPDDVTTHNIVVDEEEGLPFASENFDLAVSNLRYVQYQSIEMQPPSPLLSPLPPPQPPLGKQPPCSTEGGVPCAQT